MSALLTERIPSPIETPLVRDGDFWVKLEWAQHTGSVKYRMVHSRLLAAIRSGAIGRDTVLTEVTSGSTGVALAIAGMILGLPVELHAYEGASQKKLALIREMGARLVLHPTDTPFMDLLADVVEKARRGSHWHLGQCGKTAGVEAYEALAEEVLEQLRRAAARPIEVFVCPVGTGGLLQGVGTRLWQAFPGMSVVAVQPKPGASIEGMRNTRLVSLGVEDPFDPAFPDMIVEVAPPCDGACVMGHSIGASASAARELVKDSAWRDGLLIAAD